LVVRHGGTLPVSRRLDRRRKWNVMWLGQNEQNGPQTRVPASHAFELGRSGVTIERTIELAPIDQEPPQRLELACRKSFTERSPCSTTRSLCC
jgi:hypothetical protein